jgi:hypothetical protein
LPHGTGNLIEANEIFDDQAAPTTRYGVLVYTNPGGNVAGTHLMRNRITAGTVAPLDLRIPGTVVQSGNVLGPRRGPG